MDRRHQDRRLLLTSLLLFCLFLYESMMMVDIQELPSSSSSSSSSNTSVSSSDPSKKKTVKEDEDEGNDAKKHIPAFVPPTFPPAIEEDGEGINILCFGDSLTAGLVGIWNNKAKSNVPYASRLEPELKKLQRWSKEDGIVKRVHVNHTGLPGKTSKALIQDNADHHTSLLVDALDKFKREDGSSSLDMVIIMAGTNDFMYQQNFIYNVSESVISIHRHVLDHHIPLTIALDIPRSKIFSTDDTTLKEMDALSLGLQRFAKSEVRTTYVPFPFSYPQNDTEGYWSRDDIHCSKTGYIKLAESIAPVVQQSLQDAGLW